MKKGQIIFSKKNDLTLFSGRVLLLGGSGQVGHELFALLQGSAQLTALDRADADLAQPESLRDKVRAARPDVLINAAAYTAVDAAEREEALAHTINAQAPRVLAEECAQSKALLVHYSTDYVFDGSQRAPYQEDDPVAPQSAYGRTKLAGEDAIRASGCAHLILRTSWVYAPRGKNFVRTMLKLAGERDELRVVADQVGSPTSAASLAAATLVILSKAKDLPGLRRTFHATGEGVTSWHGFAERIVERGAALGLCRKIPVRPITTAEYPTPARRPAWSVLDNGRLQAELGVRLPAWEEALEACLGALSQAS